MATQELALTTPNVPEVTTEQAALIKRTIAAGATDDELKLFFFDCKRQGVHPLDKLVHFTKRNGKYTPITSIDFMRSRAGDTGEHAGTDDAVFSGEPKTPTFAATVIVYRMVQGVRCPFQATARWSEYCPQQNAFMWEKMPHTMLAKCAEALALRKGFPKVLSGLYAREEMDQAEPNNPVYSKEERDAIVARKLAELSPVPTAEPKVLSAQPADGAGDGDTSPAYEEMDVDGQLQCRFVLTGCTWNAKGYHKISWPGGWANSFDKPIGKFLAKLPKGTKVTAVLKYSKDGKYKNIAAILDPLPEPSKQEPLEVQEGDWNPDLYENM